MWTIEVKSSDYRQKPWREWQCQLADPDMTLEDALALALTWKRQGQAVRISWEEAPQ
jgi:hypothetical protein